MPSSSRIYIEPNSSSDFDDRESNSRSDKNSHLYIYSNQSSDSYELGNTPRPSNKPKIFPKQETISVEIHDDESFNDQKNSPNQTAPSQTQLERIEAENNELPVEAETNYPERPKTSILSRMFCCLISNNNNQVIPR